MICGGTLKYVDHGKKMTCTKCGKIEIANVYCPEGHYVCEECHGKGAYELIKNFVISTQSTDPLEIAENLLNHDEVIPMLGCEHALIAAGSLMAAFKNAGLKISNQDIEEALQRTGKQAIGAYCGLTGVCGIVPAIGSCFSVVLGAACPKNQETATTMQMVARIVEVIAEETGPCCCKNFLRTALTEAVQLARENISVQLPGGEQYICRDSKRHPHGCRKEKCRYYSVNI